MAYTRVARTNRKKGSKYKVGSRSRSIVRKAGAYGPYRSTRFVGLRSTAKKLYNPVRISRGLSPFPNTKFVRHKYVDSFVFPGGVGAGTPALYQFRANSMYDPDYTGSGHQPMFRDEMAAQYNYYTVISSYIKVTFPAEGYDKRTISMWVDDDISTPSNINQMCEQHRFYPEIKLQQRQSPLVLRAKYNGPRWNKTTLSGFMATSDNKTAVGFNPSTVAVKYYTIQCWPSYASDTLPLSSCTVEMFFITAWREPVDHTIS